MDYIKILSEIFEVCIIPLLGILTTYLVKFIQAKSKQISEEVNDDMAKKYIELLTNTITSCVIATNQTYVDSLKRQGKFDAEAQLQAFEATKNSVLTILTDEAKTYLSNLYGDLNIYITTQIEAAVKQNKI